MYRCYRAPLDYSGVKDMKISQFLVRAGAMSICAMLVTPAMAVTLSFPIQAIAGPAGLSGTFYHVGSGVTNYQVADTLAALSGATPTGTFTSTQLNYSGNDGSSVTNFLGSDAASYVGPSVSGDLSDGIFTLKGFLKITTPGTINFTGNVDDVLVLKVGGDTVLSRGCCGGASGSVTFASSGFYTFDLLYANTNYFNVGGAFVNLSGNGGPIGGLVQSVANVPEPATWASMVLGLGLVGGLMRRSNAVTSTAA